MADRMLDAKQVVGLVNLSYPTIYRMMRRDEFPKPLQVSPRNVRWLETEITEWQQNCPRNSGKRATRPRATGELG